MIILWQFESCPFCAKVRDKLSELSVDFVSVTAPKSNVEKREFLKKMGGQDMTPFIIDTEKNVAMYESDDIIKHLEDNYS
tara:strand:- start:1255 stop:1494 length:240 start_codon:yes stop_codon:yes gene_type:complete